MMNDFLFRSLKPIQRMVALCLTALFATLLFLALELPSNWVPAHSVSLQPKTGTNDVVIAVFYGDRFKRYLDAGQIEVPKVGWTKVVQADSTTLTSETNSPPLKINVKESEGIQIDLLKSSKSGIVELSYGLKMSKFIDLQSTDEAIFSLKLGGEDSYFPPNEMTFSVPNFLRAFAFAVGLIAFFWAVVVAQISRNLTRSANEVSKFEFLIYLLIPFVSSTLVALSFWPANVPYDGSLHWVQAILRGELNAPLGITATLFLRLLSYVSLSPAIAIFLQSILGAMGVSLVLLELRHRGATKKAALFAVLVLALTPQYPTFFTNLGKDAFCTVGLLFLTWSVLFFERVRHSVLVKVLVLGVVSGAAIFASLMRPNALVSAVLVIIVLSLSLFLSRQRIASGVLCVSFGLGVIYIPKLAIQFSDEQTSVANGKGTLAGMGVPHETLPREPSLPFGLSGNFYIYHFYAAAVHAGVVIHPKDEKHFLSIADREIWKKYDCYMTDTTFIAISENLLTDQLSYHKLLRTHQWEMGISVLKILWEHPKVLLSRQACITKMLWSAEYGGKPFQATTTLGYDNVDPRFEALVGKNQSKLSIGFRDGIQDYVWWTELKENFWLFWKPVIVLLIGLFCVLIRLYFAREKGLFFAVLIPTSYVATLFLVIPFPAYRYAFPPTLLMFLFLTLAFAPFKSAKLN